ncbi:MAG: transposase [Chloroflexota bacterium]
MIRTYQYRLFPTHQQQRTLDDMLDVARQFYNYALQYRRERWQESRYSVSYNQQTGMWRDWRNETPDDNPLRLLNMSAGQQLLRRLDKAYGEFLKGNRGLPRFKGKNRFHSLEFRHGDGCKLKQGERTLFYIQNVGDVKVKFHRPLPGGATIQHVILKRSCRKWYVYLQIEFDAPVLSVHAGEAVGIDVGISALLTLSNGVKVKNPRWLREAQARLRVAQRRLSRRKRGSHRRRKAAFQVAKLHEHVANTRKDFWHKTTRQLADTYSLIAIEDLRLAFMTHNQHLALSAHDAALGLFRQLLTYKAESAGGEVVAVNAYNTSQVCSCCGALVPKDLSVRVHDCPHCGVSLDRDENAARNILSLALESVGTPPSGVKVEQRLMPSLRSLRL